MELMLWALLLIPGILYTAWRWSTSDKKLCAMCGSESLIPVDSPRAREAMRAPPGAIPPVYPADRR